MLELDFTIPPEKPGYDAKVAQEFFESAGSTESVSAGKTIFIEDENSNRFFLQHDKMYFLLEGEVGLTVNDMPVGMVRKGEIFGEMALITKMPRTATATAKTECRLIAVDDKQLHEALREAPEFGLMLMGVMISHLRETIARLTENGALAADEEWKDSVVFDSSVLDDLVSELGYRSRIRYAEGNVIMQEGHAGVLMYVVLEGRVAIAIHNSIVEKIGPGGMFGEMALIERSERMASAIAETDCVLLAINRNVFLDLISSSPEFAVSLLSAVGDRARFMASRHA